MKQALTFFAGLAMLVLASACSPAPQPSEQASAAPDSATPPAWAYPVNPPGPKPSPPDETTRLSIPGSQLAFTQKELGDLSHVADWRPDDHPPMPEVVVQGRKPGVLACGYCHLPTGNGRPENARLAGLPRAYIIEQMAAYRDGSRTSAVAARMPGSTMVNIGKAATDAEIAAAADYFSALKPVSYVRVVEAAQVPKTDVAGWTYRKTGTGDEPVGQRIVEVPEEFEMFERRDPATKYVAYVPPGSIARGAHLAATLKTKDAMACADCHGADLKGVGNVPGIAGRSPSYLFRQLHDFRTGARGGAATEKMTAFVQRLSDADMLALSAYVGSLSP